MAKSKFSQNGKNFLGYIEYSLDNAEKKQFKAFRDNSDAVSNAIDKATDDDYRLTIAHDSHNDCFQCSMSIKDDSHINAGYMLVGRGDTWYTALAMAVFKHYEIMHGDWTKYRRAKAQDWD